jgi:hypothetical protein
LDGVKRKMIHTSHLLTIRANSQAVVGVVADALRQAGLQVVQSFDLQVAKAGHSHCTCPHHGSELCDCQMIMLLVYDSEIEPVTLVAHGKDGNTHLGLIDNHSSEHSTYLANLLLKTFDSKKLEASRQHLWSDAT